MPRRENRCMRAQPSAGRYFSIEPSRLVALTRDWSLDGGIGDEPRRLRNPHQAERSHQAGMKRRTSSPSLVSAAPSPTNLGPGLHMAPSAEEREESIEICGARDQRQAALAAGRS